MIAVSLGSGLVIGVLIAIGVLIVIVGALALIARAIFRRGRVRRTPRA